MQFNELVILQIYLIKKNNTIINSNLSLKLYDINYRNIFTLILLDYITKKQKLFFIENNINNLQTLTLDIIYKDINKLYNLPKIYNLDISRLSRLIKKINFIYKDTYYNFSQLILKKSDKIKIFIKEQINNESLEIVKLNQKKKITDLDLTKLINLKLNTNYSIRYITKLRNQLHIPNSFKRYNNSELHFIFQKEFSKKILLIKKNLQKLNNISGVYELHSSKPITYSNAKSNIFYIGSSKNIKRRLFSHLTSKRNKKLLKILTEEICYFRYLEITDNYNYYEKIVYKKFNFIFGESPLCNTISP